MFLLVYVDQLPGTSFGAHVTGLFHGRSATAGVGRRRKCTRTTLLLHQKLLC